MACGDNHTAVIAGEDVYTWGLGTLGQLGHGEQRSEAVPRCVEGLRGQGAVEVSCGAGHTVVRCADGRCAGPGGVDATRIGWIGGLDRRECDSDIGDGRRGPGAPVRVRAASAGAATRGPGRRT